MPRLAPLLLFVALCLVCPAARAHDAFEITTTGKLERDSMDLHITLTRGTASMLIAGNSEAPAFKPEAFAAMQPQLEALAARFFTLSPASAAAQPRSVRAALTVENEVELFLVYPRPPPGPLFLTTPLLAQLGPGYGNAVNLTERLPPSVLGIKLLTADDPTLDVIVAAPAPTSPAAQPAASAAAAPDSTTASTAGPRPAESTASPPPSVRAPALFKEFFKLGIKHILEGYDHLLFLAGLLVAVRRVRTMITIITCFTLAHSITLALAALDVVVLSPRVVEPLIAASIVFVGIENLVRRDEPKGRWLLAFVFGLIHGFGFAGVLRTLGLGRDGLSLVTPLLSFNLGVEFGQLLVAAIILPLLLKLGSDENVRRKMVTVASLIVAALGAYWFIERVFLS